MGRRGVAGGPLDELYALAENKRPRALCRFKRMGRHAIDTRASSKVLSKIPISALPFTVMACGAFTILDDFSRYIIAWKCFGAWWARAERSKRNVLERGCPFKVMVWSPIRFSAHRPKSNSTTSL
jgi:hypothetical protein